MSNIIQFKKRPKYPKATDSHSVDKYRSHDDSSYGDLLERYAPKEPSFKIQKWFILLAVIWLFYQLWIK